MNSVIKKYMLTGGIVFFSLFMKLLAFAPHQPFWDASAYLLMGKYFFSLGHIGLIEPFRPIAWPLLLGFVWKMGGDPILGGMILGVVFSVGNIVLVYLIGEKAYNSMTGMTAALFLSLSPTFIFWESSILTPELRIRTDKNDFYEGFFISAPFSPCFFQQPTQLCLI